MSIHIADIIMKKIKKTRFDALAGYIRDFRTQQIGKEVGWYEQNNILAVIFFDYTDQLYNIIILGQDENLKFRCVDCSIDFRSKQSAEQEIQRKLNFWTTQPIIEFTQGDRQKKALDFLNPLFPEQDLNFYFKELIFNDAYLPAKQLISYLIRYYETDDVGVVGQFQKDGFHSRIWELYLYAMFSEINFSFELTDKVDFLCQNHNGKIAVEATCINPKDPNRHDIPLEECQKEAQNLDKICIKINDVLIRKLRKKYWEKFENVPLVIAIQDFSYPFSSQLMTLPLMIFLYGERLKKDKNIYNKMIDIKNHKWEHRTRRSNFWAMSDSENISAVICNTQGTLPKFNRMGILAGFKSISNSEIKRSMIFMQNGDFSNIKTTEFIDINNDNYSETWCEGLNVFHNPKAKIPLNPSFFPNAFHYRENQEDIYPPFYVFNSQTRRIKK